MSELINARWKACRPAMVRAFGEARTAVLLDRLIPLQHDGKVLVLGAPSAWHRDWVVRQFSQRLAKILGQPIRVQLSEVATRAEARMKVGGRDGAPASAPGRG